MKKVFAILLTLTMALSLLAGCGSSKKEEQPAETNDTKTEQPAEAAPAPLSGAVALNGSTSMEKVVGALQTLSDADLDELTRDGKTVEVTCRFCDAVYEIAPEEIRRGRE